MTGCLCGSEGNGFSFGNAVGGFEFEAGGLTLCGLGAPLTLAVMTEDVP
jgi:hypothetical protein